MSYQKHNREYFYRYLTAEGALDTLLMRRIRFASPKVFNDPDDAKFDIKMPFSSSDEYLDFVSEEIIRISKNGSIPTTWKINSNILELIKSNPDEYKKAFLNHFSLTYKTKFQQYHEDINTLIAKVFSNLFFYCLTENLDNEKMWIECADKYQGAVIKFKCLPEIDNLFLIAKKVVYLKNLPTYGDKEAWANRIAGNYDPQVSELFDNKYATKLENWKHENEWRIIDSFPECEGQNYAYRGLTTKEVDSLYLGYLMPLEHKLRLYHAIKRCYPEAKIFDSICDNNNLIQ